MNIKNLILDVDSYKFSHYMLYPTDAAYVSSYIESRGGDYDFTLFFGLQMFLKEYMKPITLEDIDEAEEVVTSHGFTFNREGWMYILNEHGGNLPIRIQAVKEGSVIPTKNVLVQVVNTDPNVPWLTSFVETMLLRAIWYPTSVATRSKYIKNLYSEFLNRTSDIAELVLSTRLHDFGARGVSSFESAGIGGAAHLVNFIGSDTVTGLLYARKYYGEVMAGFSIPASEHSISTSYGRDHVHMKQHITQDGKTTSYPNPYTGENLYADRMVSLLESGKFPYVACVSDTYDIYNFVGNIIGETFRDRIKASGATLVIRPDSGDPTKVPVEILGILGEKFGFTVNEKGYKVLHNSVRLINGDGMNDESIKTLLENLEDAQWSAENLVVGMGGGLLQSINRDTLKFAMKASAYRGKNDFEYKGIFKDPVTDPGKTSKKGRLELVRYKDGTIATISHKQFVADVSNIEHCYLEEVWENGKFIRNQTFKEIREISNS